jgi:hypothetical protein
MFEWKVVEEGRGKMTTTPAIPASPVPAQQGPVAPPKPPIAPTATMAPAQPTSVFSQVSAANAGKSPLTAKLASRTRSTFDIHSPWARILIHGEIDSWKTTTAAHFGTPEQTRIILTRGEDQLLPIINEGYQFVKVNDAAEFTEALTHCDHIWPDWAKLPEPVLVIDDITKAKDYIVTASKTYEANGQIKEYKDNRKIFGVAIGEFDAMFSIANRKPIHIIMTALSKVMEGKISLEETVTPDLSQGIGNLVMSDYSFIFFLNKKKPFATRLLTQLDSEAVTEFDETQRKSVTYQRYYFARNKIPSELVGKVMKLYEEADLRKIWEKVKNARRSVSKPTEK